MLKIVYGIYECRHVRYKDSIDILHCFSNFFHYEYPQNIYFVIKNLFLRIKILMHEVIIQNKHSWSQIQVQIKIKKEKKQKKTDKQLPSRSKNVKIKFKQWICFIRCFHTWTNTYYDLLQNVTWSKQFHICIRWKAFIINLECWGLFHINEFTMVVRPNVQRLLLF